MFKVNSIKNFIAQFLSCVCVCFTVSTSSAQSEYDSISRFTIGVYTPKFERVKYQQDKLSNRAFFNFDPSEGLYLNARLLSKGQHSLNLDYNFHRLRTSMAGKFSVVDVRSGTERDFQLYQIQRNTINVNEIGLNYNFRQKITRNLTINLGVGASFEFNNSTDVYEVVYRFSGDDGQIYQVPFFSFQRLAKQHYRYNLHLSLNYLTNLGEFGLYFERNKNWKSRYVNGIYEVYDEIDTSNSNIGNFDIDGDYYSFGITFTPRKGFLKKKK